MIRVVEQTEAQGKAIADKQAADAAKAAEAAKAAGAASAPSAGGGQGGSGGGGAQPYPVTGFVDGKRLVSQRVEVKLGIRRPGRVEITEGLSESDTVIIAGQQRVQRDNTPVRVIELGRPPAGAGAVSGAPSQSPGQSAGGGVGGAVGAVSAASAPVSGSMAAPATSMSSAPRP